MAERLPIYCHQCHRNKHHVFCCTYIKKDKMCILKYCQNCIARSYPREEAERAQLSNWLCPRCREMCNCCTCRGKIGPSPIGKKCTNIDQKKCRKKRVLSPIGRKPTKVDQRKYVEMADRARAELMVLQGQESLLPIAIPITKVAGIDMAVENVGPALQFLEHCRNFSQTVYNLKDGEAERILDEIIKGWDGSSGQLSVLEEFQRDLLTIILTDKKTRRSSSSGSSLAGDAWVAAVERLIDLESLFRNVPRDYFQSGSCYHQLDANWKLRILNFLCDLVLVTKKLKRFRPIPREKEFNWKELPASQKVIALWKELKDEEAKAVQSPEDGMVLSFEEEEEYERRLSALKEEFRKAYLEMLDALTDHNLCPERSAKRVKPLTSHTSGRIFSQIEGYMESSSIAIQDVENRDPLSNKDSIDKWYVFPKEDGAVIEEYCSSKRIWEGILNSALEHIPDGILQNHVPDFNKQEELEVHPQRRKVQPLTTKNVKGVRGKARTTDNGQPSPLDKWILESRPQELQRLYRLLEGKPKTDQDIWVPIEKEVFQLPESTGTLLGFDDMKLMMNRGWLDASIISVFMLHLFSLCSQIEGNRCAFLLPNSIDQGAIKNSHDGVVRYIKDAMMITSDASIQFLLAPYLQSEHWSLLLIWPRRSRVYILDPKKSVGKTPETREIYSVLNKAFEQYRGDDGPIDIPRLDLQWEEPTWRQQRDNWECGYYVMKDMHSFVTNHQNNFPNEWFPNDPRPYTLEDVDGIASMCSVFCEKCLKNASN